MKGYRVRVEYEDGRINQFGVGAETKQATEKMAHREADSFGQMPGVRRAYVLNPGEPDPGLLINQPRPDA